MGNSEHNRFSKALSTKGLRVGDTLPWSVYNRNGTLLLPKGALITSRQQIERLSANHTHRNVFLSNNAVTSKQEENNEPVTAFVIARILLNRLGEAFSLIHDVKDTSFPHQIMQLVLDIQVVCNENADSIMGAMHLIFDAPHGLVHPLHAAILCEVSCRRMGKGPLDRFPIVAAALTHDIGILEVQQELYEQNTPLTPDQQKMIKAHPARGYALLKRKGVTDTCWLDPVLHHHERLDGSGYPDGLKGYQLTHGTKLLAIADCYSAMIRPRAYRRHLLPKDALKEIFQERGHTIDSELARLFINVMGIFSPGSLVKLGGGTIGVVIGQGSGISEPQVVLLTDNSGNSLSTPKTVNTGEGAEEIIGMACPLEYAHLLENISVIWPILNPISGLT